MRLDVYACVRTYIRYANKNTHVHIDAYVNI